MIFSHSSQGMINYQQTNTNHLFWKVLAFFGLSKLVDRRLKTTIKLSIRQLPHVDLLPQVKTTNMGRILAEIKG